MQIGKLNDHCGKCPLIGYCSDPYETPWICHIEALHDVDTETYLSLAKSITQAQINEKIKQNTDDETNGISWSNERDQAICDIIIEQLKV